MVVSVDGIVLGSSFSVVAKPSSTRELTLVEDVEGSLTTSDRVVSSFSAKELATFQGLDDFDCFLDFHGCFLPLLLM